MDGYLIWMITGFALIIIELVTGTFFLLVLGIGAFAGAAVNWFGGTLLAQCAAAGVIALIGTYFVYQWRERQKATHSEHSNVLDLGQTVVFESWVDQKSGAARVKHRGASWDAVIEAGHDTQPGNILYITGQSGQMLKVSTVKP